MASGFNIDFFKLVVDEIKNGNITTRQESITKLLNCDGLQCHMDNLDTNRGVYSIADNIEYEHEKLTAIKLTAQDYDVVFLPDGYFERGRKKFDVFLCRDHFILECDLKFLTSDNPDTIADRIIKGSYQAKRLVVDIQSGIEKKVLIDGLRSGCERNENIKEVMLFYKRGFYRLFTTQILNKRTNIIYDIIK